MKNSHELIDFLNTSELNHNTQPVHGLWSSEAHS